ncbi:MAG: hypothetical protein ACYC10_10810 [Allorhizobium sp.]
MNIVAELLAAMAIRRVEPVVADVKRNSVAAFVATVLFLTAYVALVVALALYVSSEAGPVAAAIVVALTAIALGLFVIAVVMILNRQARRRAMIQRQIRAQTNDPLSAGLLAALPAMIQESPVATTVMIGSLVFALAKAGGYGRKS